MYTIAMPPFFPYRVTPPDLTYLKKMLTGLLEAFPTYSQDFFMYYLYTKEGVKDHYTISQLAKIVLKQSEKPQSDSIIKHVDNYKENSSNKENMSLYSNNIQSRIISGERITVPFNSGKLVPRISNGIYAMDKIKTNLLEQIEEEGIHGHPIFYTEEHSESLNDEDYEYTQLNTSTLKELSDLGKEASMDDKGQKSNVEERVSCLIDNDLFCSEDINEVFLSEQ